MRCGGGGFGVVDATECQARDGDTERASRTQLDDRFRRGKERDGPEKGHLLLIHGPLLCTTLLPRDQQAAAQLAG